MKVRNLSPKDLEVLEEYLEDQEQEPEDEELSAEEAHELLTRLWEAEGKTNPMSVKAVLEARG